MFYNRGVGKWQNRSIAGIPINEAHNEVYMLRKKLRDTKEIGSVAKNLEATKGGNSWQKYHSMAGALYIDNKVC